MNKLKPKVSLDKDILQEINSYYSWKLGSSALFTECFSHPLLESHTCNPMSLMDGGDKCTYCNHAPGGICKITCHVNHFCLVVFGYRLGIGGDDLKEAIRHNLKLGYKNLHKLVVDKLSDVENISNEAQDLSKVDSETMEDDMKEKKINKPSKTDKPATKSDAAIPVVDKDGSELVTIGKASEMYGCSYHNMYVHVKKGNLVKVSVGDKDYVKKSEVLGMMEKREAKK